MTHENKTNSLLDRCNTRKTSVELFASGRLDEVVKKHTRVSRRHTAKHKPVRTHSQRPADLLDVFFGPDVRRVHQRAHNLQVAVDHEGLVRPVSVDAHPAVVVHRIWQLAPLPQHLVVAFKLAWVGSLMETHGQMAPQPFLIPHPHVSQ